MTCGLPRNQRPARKAGAPRFVLDDRGFTGAEKALLLCFLLAIAVTAGALIRRGGERAASDARATLVAGAGAVGPGGQLGTILAAGELPRAAPGAPASPPPEAPPPVPAQKREDDGGILGSIGGFLGDVGSTVGSALGVTLSYTSGAVGQLASNVAFGALDGLLDQVPSGAFQQGRNLGDAASVAVGAFEMFEGGGMVAGGVAIEGLNLAAEGLTLGAWTPGFVGVTIVDGAAVAIGVGIFAHGMYMVGKGLSGGDHGGDEGGGEGGRTYSDGDVDELIRDTNKDFPLSRDNAKDALKGPEGTRAEVAGPGGEGADIKFRDGNGNVVFEREVKSISGGPNSFNTDMSKAAKQINYKGEVYVQAPAGTNGQQWIDSFRGRRSAADLARYKDVAVKIVDPSGNVLYQGPLAAP